MAPATSTDRPLWLLFRGAPAAVPAAWIAWVAAVALSSPRLAAAAGPAGSVIAVLAAGWFLARALPVPLEWLRRYHLDDAELAVLGPGRRVRRVAWEQVDTVTQGRGALRLAGPGIDAALPLGAALRSGAWGTVLARVVPGIAAAMWARIDDGEEVRLTAPAEPALAALLWWAWTPALAASVLGGASAETALVLCLAERLVAAARAHGASVSLHRTGVALRTGLRDLFVSWRRAEVTRAADGLVVSAVGGEGGVVASRLPNFWAAAPVIETRAQLDAGIDAIVTFRVRVADGRLAVVGEIERAA
jgi:hypothetical protein